MFYAALADSVTLPIELKHWIIREIPWLTQEQADGLFLVFEQEDRWIQNHLLIFGSDGINKMREKAEAEWDILIERWNDIDRRFHVPAFRRRRVD